MPGTGTAGRNSKVKRPWSSAGMKLSTTLTATRPLSAMMTMRIVAPGAAVPEITSGVRTCVPSAGAWIVSTRPGPVVLGDAVQRPLHEAGPDLRGQPTAHHAPHRRVVIVAHPDRGDELRGEADEPGVAVVVGGPGLARGRRPRGGGGAPGAGGHGPP